MIAKIDFLKILKGHFRTLHRNGSASVSIADIMLFYGAPAIVAAFVVFWMDRQLSDKAVDFLATVFSIFIGLLLNLLVLIFDHAKKSDKPVQRRVLQETFANISYSILVSVLLVALLMLAKLSSGLCVKIVSLVVATMVGNFFLTLLMVLKRVHTLVWEETQN